MFAFLSKFFFKKGISLFAPIPLGSCRIQKPYLLERAEIRSGTVIMIAVPYFTKQCLDKKRNISCYAVSRDYHGFYRELFDELLPLLKQNFPQYRFAGFADHSPIAEIDAAARAGLGAIGKNHLLITEPYSSFVFLGCLVTDAVIPCEAKPIKFCEACGKCISSCPAKTPSDCLSALTQKKGALTDEEQQTILRHGSAWGCDICQMICPHTVKAIRSETIYTTIPYFREQSLPCLTSEILDDMTEEAFASRAYAWRGRDTIKRNLILLETQSQNKKGESSC